MADVTKQSPSLDQYVGGPTDSKLGGNMKPGGFQRPSGNNNASSNGTVTSDSTVAGKG